jgi:hypothetical protein
MTDTRGLKFELETEEEVATFLRHGGHFERAELEICVAYLDPGMVALDVGANIGAFTTAFAAAVTSSGAVHSFEPFAAARARLERTLELNGLDWVRVHPFAIGDEDDGELETMRLETWAQSASVERINLVKVAVKGAERRLLSGAAGLLQTDRIDMALIDVSDRTLESFEATAAELMRLLEAYGLRTFVASGGAMVPFRIAGRQNVVANVFAVSPRALARLRARGLCP